MAAYTIDFKASVKMLSYASDLFSVENIYPLEIPQRGT
jgi:N-glycosylase/DNA lyase